MSWQTFLNGFAPGGNQGVQARQTQIDDEKQRMRQSAEDHDMKLADMMDAMGAQPVQSGMVHRQVFTPPSGDFSDIPGVASGPRIPGTSGYVLDKADPSRVVTHKTADGQTVQWERPSVEQQMLRAAHQRLANLQNPENKEAVMQDQRQTAAGVQANSRAHATGFNQAAQDEREGPAGVDVPGSLDQYLPGISKGPDGKPRRVLPGAELDNTIKATGSYADLTSKAETRGQPKPKEVQSVHITKDDKGNQTQVTVFKDGTSQEKPLSAKGETKATPGGITGYQQYEMKRNEQKDAEARVLPWQKRIEDAQAEEDKIGAENVGHGREMVEIGTQLQNGELTGKAAKTQAKRRMDTLQALIDKNNQRVETLHSTKKNAQTIKDSIFGANGGAPAAAAPAQQQRPGAAKVVSMAQLAAYAKKNNIDIAAAQSAAKAEGYSVR